MEDLGKPRRSLDYLPEAMVEEMLGKHSGVVQQVSSLLQDAVKTGGMSAGTWRTLACSRT